MFSPLSFFFHFPSFLSSPPALIFSDFLPVPSPHSLFSSCSLRPGLVSDSVGKEGWGAPVHGPDHWLAEPVLSISVGCESRKEKTMAL